MYLRDLIDTANVYLKMMEKYCQGSIVVQTRMKKSKPTKKKPTKVKSKKKSKPKQVSKNNDLVREIIA